MATIQEKIDALEKSYKERMTQLKNAEEAIQARKLTALMKGKRSEDTRRKILIGAMMLDHMEKNEATKTSVMSKLDAFLTRQDDRALFDLPETEVGGKHAPATNE